MAKPPKNDPGTNTDASARPKTKSRSKAPEVSPIGEELKQLTSAMAMAAGAQAKPKSNATPAPKTEKPEPFQRPKRAATKPVKEPASTPLGTEIKAPPAPKKTGTPSSATTELSERAVSEESTSPPAESTKSATDAPVKTAPVAEVAPAVIDTTVGDPNVAVEAQGQAVYDVVTAANPSVTSTEAFNQPAQEPESTSEPQSVNVQEPLPEEVLTEAFIPRPAPTMHAMPTLYIVHVAPEMAPVAKVGGLADVVFGLTRELAIRGNHVEIVLPKYSNMRYDHIYDLQPVFNDLWVPWYGGAIHCTVYFGFVYDRKCFFIEPHSNDNFFNRGSVYGYPDDVMRYAFFSRAAIEFLWRANKHPDIIHCHDWQTALVPVFLYEFYQRMGMTHPRVCLTIHNFQHQGVTGGELLRATGLNHPERFFDYNRLRDNQHPNALNLMKGGIVYSNFVTTVSPRYAFESKDQGQGFGLEPTLHTHQIKYGGVINGIDYDVWNPEVDHHISVRYGLGSLDKKYDNKRALRHRLMLADNEKPIIAFIGRLDPQKGLDLVRHAIFYSMERGAQFVLLGSSPYNHINTDFWGLKRMLNDSPDCHLEIGFNEELSHLIYAGADMILVPSRFEPCGLTQLVALRYGTIPVVRSVGGLADTVFDKDYSDRPLHARNGYVFNNYDPPGLESALGRAIACYYNFPEHFRELIKNAMRCDYSWNFPGRDYLNIYDYIRSK